MTTLTGTRSTESVPTVSVKRIFNASPERVFQAWTNPEFLSQWFGPRGLRTQVLQCDLTPGGKYLIRLHDPEGKIIEHFGEYVQISPPTRLIFTWTLDNQDCTGSKDLCADTLVSLHFKDVNGKTELELTHEKLPTQTARDAHRFGWNSSLDCLHNFLEDK